MRRHFGALGVPAVLFFHVALAICYENGQKNRVARVVQKDV